MKMNGSPVQTWDEIVFENRNKDYGAFIIRKIYSKNVLIGGASTAIIILILLLWPIIIAFFQETKISGMMDVPNNASSLELTSPPPIEKNIRVKLTQPPSVTQLVKYVAPVVTAEKIAEPEEIPPMEEVKQKETTSKTVEEKSAEGEVQVAAAGGSGDGAVFDLAESMPHFIGGNDALGSYIANTIRYPATAQRMKLQGTVFVSFVVNEDGSIGEVKTIKGFFADCDKEAERVIRSMPLWEPGRNNGKPVKVRLALPIKFRLGH